MTGSHARRVLLCGTVAGVLLLLGCTLSLCTGSYPLTLADLPTAFREWLAPGGEQSLPTRVLFGLRLPRTLTALVSGAVLGVCGGVYQMLFASPLASPDLTGISSGASFGAALAIVCGFSAPFARMGMAFLGGILSLVLVLLLVRAARGEQRNTYILAGILLSSTADAGLILLKTMADPERELAAIDFWTMGSLAAVSSDRAMPFLFCALPALCLLLLFHRAVTLLSLGPDACRAAGLSPQTWRAILLGLATLAVSASTALTGVIGFCGLLAPHITYFLLRRKSGVYLPFCAAIGSILLLTADVCARSLGGGAELPISLFTIAAGVPVLAILLCTPHRNGGD